MDTGNCDLILWNNLISAEILKTAQAGKPIYLYLDEQLLSKASGIEDKHEARDSFCAAFTSYDDGEIRYDRNSPFKHAYALWRKFLKEPEKFDYPFLAGIYFTVLSVTCDSPMDGILEHNVYKKMRWLLGFPIEELGLGIPPDFEAKVKLLYQQWNDFLSTDLGSEYGVATATPGRLTHQGWAWSQCLLRPKDRWKILEWIEEEQVDASDTESLEFLAEAFLKWLRRQPLEGRRLLSRLYKDNGESLNKEYFEIFLKIFEDELTTTVIRDDDVVLTRSGLITINQDFETEISMAFKIDDNLDGLEVSYNGQVFALNKSSSPIRFSASDLPTDFLSNGATINLNPLEVNFSPKEVYILEEVPNDDSYIQCNKTYLNQRYLILTQLKNKHKVKKDFESSGVEESSEEQLSNGWVLFKDVVFKLAVENQANCFLPLPKDSISPVLQGGLEIAPATYLIGGEPVLQIPERFVFDVTINGKQFLNNRARTSLPLRLRSNLGLQKGINEVKVREKIFRFELSDGLVDVPHISFSGMPLDSNCFKPNTNQTQSNSIPTLFGNCLNSDFQFQFNIEHYFKTSVRDDLYAVTSRGEVFKVNHLPKFSLDISALPRWASWEFLERRLPRETRSLLLGVTKTSQLAGSLNVVDVPPHIQLNRNASRRMLVSNRNELLNILDSISSDTDSVKSAIRNQIPKNDSNLAGAKSVSKANKSLFTLSSTYPDQSNLDLALEWLSEIPSGEVSAITFKKAWDHLVRISPNPEKMDSNLALFNLQQLGHVDLVGRSRKVQVNRPHVHLLSGTGDHLVLSGARPRKLIRDLLDPTQGDFTDLQDLELQFIKGPEGMTSFYFTFDPEDIDHILKILNRAGIVWGGDFKKSFGSRFLSFEEKFNLSNEAENAPVDLKLKRRDGQTTDSGIYVYQPHLGKEVFFYKTPESRLVHVTKALANSAFRFYSISNEANALWSREKEALTILGSVQLDINAHKWLCAHSGLLPIFDPKNRSRTYMNIPLRSVEKLEDSYYLKWKVEL